MRRHFLFAVALLLARATVAPTLASAQGLTPADARESARFTAMTAAVARAGYANPLVVGHGSGKNDWLFLLTATRADSGVLIAVAERRGGGVVNPVALERDRDPAQLGIRDVHFAPFLGSSDFVNVTVSHQPLTLEMSRSFATHHVLRRQGDALARACDIAGNATTSASKGIGTMTSTRRVAITRVAGASPLTFDVRTSDETSESTGRDTVRRITATADNTSRYVLPPTGNCRMIR